MRPCLSALLLLSACTASETATPLDDLPGTLAWMVPDADLSRPDSFFDLPFPSDLRVVDGVIDLSGMPRPPGHVQTAQLLLDLEGVGAFSAIPTVHLRFHGPPAAVSLADGALGTDVEARAFFLALTDPAVGPSLVPAVGLTPPVDAYIQPDMLSLSPYPGFVLDPSVRWAAVVRRGWGDAAGQPLGSPAWLREALRGTVDPADGPAEALTALADLGARLTALGVPLDDVAIATTFAVRDVVGETRALVDAVAARFAPALTGLVQVPTEGSDRYCELHATVRLPQFQVGTPPFTTDGLFEEVDGELVVQRQDDVPVVITLPRGEMPAAGWPLVVYAHGSDGLSTQVVDRGPVWEVGGEQAPGLGPAHVLAGRGLAAASAGLLLGPERLGYEGSRAYLNLLNLAAYRDTWRQGMIDMRLLVDALAQVQIPAAVVGDCGALPPGQTTYRLDVEPLMLMGQSAGGHLATEMAAVDDRVRAFVPTGSGGYWSELLGGGSRVGGPPELFAFALGTNVALSRLHPGLALLQWAWEPAEPLVYAAWSARQTDHVRHLYLPVGADDGYFPEPIYDAMAVAAGTERAGPAVWGGMDDGLALAGLRADRVWPVTGNVEDRTAVVVQWAGDGLADSHGIFAQLDEVKHQYGCFFRTLLDDGVPTVVAPGPSDGPCEVDPR